jgi:subtilisin family serine protease
VHIGKQSRLLVAAVTCLSVLAGPSLVSAAPSTAQPSGTRERMVVVPKTAADFDALRAQVQRAGGSIVKELRGAGVLVVTGPPALKNELQASGRAKGVAKDPIRHLIRPNMAEEMWGRAGYSREKTTVGASPAVAAAAAARNGRRAPTGDPALGFQGLLWNLIRINSPEAWRITTGAPAVRIGVADTGLDYTHAELESQVVHVQDFTVTEDPPLCKTLFPNPITGAPSPGLSDADLAAMFGGPANTDWHGHGSWIGGNIGAALDGSGTNGIVPRARLVALKISGWCGSAYDSTVIEAFQWAADNDVDIVSISFGGYLDLGDPEQALIWTKYLEVVEYARQRGTVIVAAAGNDHVRIGTAGLVLSHGPLALPGTTPKDFEEDDVFGHFETPGGLPGVVMVSSTNNVNNASSPSCLPASQNNNNAVCKPMSDRHQAPGTGLQNQLAYYSNYGPRIDVTGPGGARKFNVPAADRGGTPGFPVTTADLTNAWQDFSITSNWGLGITCFVFSAGSGFPEQQCYSTIQGTSMSTPHASAVLAIIASNDRQARGNVDRMVRVLKNTAREITGNTTQPLSAADTTPADLTGVACPSGYCHLGGTAIPDSEAYGAGLVDAQVAARRTD